MLIKEILFTANIKCDDNVDAYTQLIYANTCINILNLDGCLKLPLIKNGDLVKEYIISDDDYVNELFANIMTTFIAYHIKKTDGYTDNENPFYRDFLAQKINLLTNFLDLIKPEYTDTKNILKSKQGKIHKIKGLSNTRLW